jgi:hypothetical protein
MGSTSITARRYSIDEGVILVLITSAAADQLAQVNNNAITDV